MCPPSDTAPPPHAPIPGCRPVSTAHTLGGVMPPSLTLRSSPVGSQNSPEGAERVGQVRGSARPEQVVGSGHPLRHLQQLLQGFLGAAARRRPELQPCGCLPGALEGGRGGAGCPRALPPGSLSTPFWNTPASLRSLQIGDQGARCGDLGGWSLLRANPRPQAVTEGTAVATPNPDLCAD